MSDRQRVWAFILYPESAPSDWLVRLSDSHIPAAVSPVHDRDLDYDHKVVFPHLTESEVKKLKYSEIKEKLTSLGILKYKKPHIHILLNYSGVKTYDQVQTVSQYVAGTNPIKIDEIGGYARYLIHFDDPDKFLYYKQDVMVLSGFDYQCYFDMPKSKVSQYLKEISYFIIDNDIREFADLHDFCLINKPEWYYVIMQVCTSSVEKVIKSRRHKLKLLEEAVISQDGELIPNVE